MYKTSFVQGTAACILPLSLARSSSYRMTRVPGRALAFERRVGAAGWPNILESEREEFSLGGQRSGARSYVTINQTGREPARLRRYLTLTIFLTSLFR